MPPATSHLESDAGFLQRSLTRVQSLHGQSPSPRLANSCRERRAVSPEKSSHMVHEDGKKRREAWQVGDTRQIYSSSNCITSSKLHLITREWTETLHRRLRVHSVRLRCEYKHLKTSTCAPGNGRERGPGRLPVSRALGHKERCLLGQT